MKRNRFDEILGQGLKELGLPVDDTICACFFNYLQFLCQENSKYNLTAVTDEREIITRHFLDSVAPLSFLHPRPGITVIDVGSGGGFPGLPLKIIHRGLKMILLEASLKKSLFLNRLLYKLNLDQNLEVIQNRAEKEAHGHLRENCDWIMARAVAPLKVLVEYTLPFLEVGGIAFYYKGPEYRAELDEAEYPIDLLGGNMEGIRRVEVPYLKEERYIVMVKKGGYTPDKFPRRPGVPKKRPLEAGKF